MKSAFEKVLKTIAPQVEKGGEFPTFYINSWPRSGNTWTRKMIKDIVEPIDLDQNKVLQERDVHVPDVVEKGGGMIKNHGRYETCYGGIPIVYLVRDGRDSLYSYYHYNVTHHAFDESWSDYFDRVILQDRMTTFRELNLRNLMGTWAENVESYLDRDRVHIIRYEDLKTDTRREMMDLFEFVGVDVSRENVSSVIEKYERQLKAKQKESNRPRGTTMAWKQSYTERQNEIFCQKFGGVLDRFGYNADT